METLADIVAMKSYRYAYLIKHSAVKMYGGRMRKSTYY
jgi:hypothetical protein